MSVNSSKDSAADALAIRAAAGDDKAMAELIEVITPAAKAKAAKLNSGYTGISDDDLVQEGMIGFLEAVKRFDPGKGVPFKAYANICIESRIISAIRRMANDKNAALTNAVSIDDSSEEIAPDDPAAEVADNDAADRLYDFMDRNLSGFEKRVLRLKLLDYSYSDLAGELGCSEKSVDNAIQRIRKKLSKTN